MSEQEEQYLLQVLFLSMLKNQHSLTTLQKSASGVGGNGGAIYSTGNSIVTVTDSIFIDNAGDADAGIHADGATFTISNSVILAKSDDTNFALNKVGSTVIANDNFWGDNSKANTNANVAKMGYYECFIHQR